MTESRKKKNTALLVAAGAGKRMGTDTHKQFLELQGRPILAHTLQVFQDSACIDAIVVVTGKEDIPYVREDIVRRYGFSKVTAVAAGGAERYESVYQGLLHCEDADYVFIQDAVRPFVTEEILQRGWETVQRYGSAICGMPAKDTIKITDPEGKVLDTPPRDRLWIVQTPQIFSYSLIRKAYERLFAEKNRETGAKEKKTGQKIITDDAMVAESMGAEVHMFTGSYRNIKITTPEDLLMAEALL